MGRGGGDDGGFDFSGGSSDRGFSGGWGSASSGRGGGFGLGDWDFGGGCFEGCGCSSLLGIIGFIFLMFLISFFFGGCTKASTKYADANAVNKEKLSSSVLTKTDYWIEDNANWLDKEETVENAMEHFLDKTGVQPYLIIDTSVNGNKSFDNDDVKNYLDVRYDNLFKDEAHMIFIFLEPYKNQYYRAMYTGRAAKTIIDEKAQKIIYDIVDRNYTDKSLTDDEYFAKIFNDSANKIMAKVTTANDVKNTRVKTLGIIFVVIIIGTVAVKVSKNKAKEKEEARKILDKEF